MLGSLGADARRTGFSVFQGERLRRSSGCPPRICQSNASSSQVQSIRFTLYTSTSQTRCRPPAWNSYWTAAIKVRQANGASPICRYKCVPQPTAAKPTSIVRHAPLETSSHGPDGPSAERCKPPSTVYPQGLCPQDPLTSRLVISFPNNLAPRLKQGAIKVTPVRQDAGNSLVGCE